MALPEPRPGDELLREQLEKFSHSAELGRSKRLLRFLNFTVEQSLNGAADSLSEYTIGRAVYDRPENFDPLTDGIVRVEVHRLRAKLREYYSHSGQHDPLIVDYPVGSYVPVFRTSGPEFLPREGRVADAIRGKDWSASPLGPIRDWPRGLKTALGICLRAKFPMAVCWGPQFVLIFNDAMHSVIGEEGAVRLGCPLAAIEGNWSQLESVFRRVVDHNETVYWERQQWLSVRHGFEREAYFTTSFSPISESEGPPLGVLVMTTEVTADVLLERRNRTLTQLSTVVPEMNETEGCREVMRILEQNPYDVPFATLYVFDPARSQAELRGCAGIQPGTVVSAPFFAIAGAVGPITGAVVSGRPEVLDIGHQLGPLPSGAWRAAPQQIVVLPLRSVRDRESIGALIAGVNPHRRMDSGYRTFFEIAARHIAIMLIRSRAIERENHLLADKERQIKAWSALADYAANEFRTPLTILLGLLDQLQPAYTEKSSYGRKFALARRNALRVSHLVDSLMELIEMQSGRLRPVFEPIDLAATTEELVRAFTSALERRNLTFVLDFPSLEESVYVDRRMWDRVILSLLVHAVHRTRDGEIGVSLRKMGAWVETTIWDTGEGIPGSELPHIFEPFPPAASGGARNRTGLAVAQHFATAHGGRITVESEIGKGCKFTVSIPRGHAHLDPQRMVDSPNDTHNSFLALHAYLEEALRWTPEEALRDPEPESAFPATDSSWQQRTLLRSERRRILVAAADRDLRQYLSSVAGELYQVDVVEDSESALRSLEHMKPDVLVADMDLHGTDGLAVVRAVRAGTGTNTLPVLLISPHASEENRLRAFAAGANDYLVKPFSAPELLVRLESQITLADMQRRISESGKSPLQDEAHLTLLAQALDQLPHGVVVVDRASATMVVRNRRIRQLFGEFPAKVVELSKIPDPFGTFPDGTPVSRNDCPLVRSGLKGETVTDCTIQYDIPDGMKFTAKLTGHPLYDADGTHLGALVLYWTDLD